MVKNNTIRPGSYATVAEAKEGGTGGDAVWGAITGTLNDQTDLKQALDAKQGTLTAGENITIVDNVISASGDVSAEWGTITGTLADQADLKQALDAKQDAGDYATESYVDSAVAVVDQEVDDLTDDVGELTEGLAGVESRVGTAETAIETLVDDVDAVESRMTTAEGDIDALETEVAGKQDELTAGDNITIVDNVISASGGSDTGKFEVIYQETEFDDIVDAYNDDKQLILIYPKSSTTYQMELDNVYFSGTTPHEFTFSSTVSSHAKTTTIVVSKAGTNTTYRLSIFTAAKESDVNTALDAKQDAPATAGTEGQVLGLNEDLEPEWIDVGGGGDVPENMVTTDTEQTITGKKTFEYTRRYTQDWSDGYLDTLKIAPIVRDRAYTTAVKQSLPLYTIAMKGYSGNPENWFGISLIGSVYPVIGSGNPLSSLTIGYSSTSNSEETYRDTSSQATGATIYTNSNKAIYGTKYADIIVPTKNAAGTYTNLVDDISTSDAHCCVTPKWTKSLMPEVTFTADGTSVSYDVSHSLGKMPSIVQVTDDTGKVAEDVHITKTTNTITVMFDTAPAQGTVFTVGMLY